MHQSKLGLRTAAACASMLAGLAAADSMAALMEPFCPMDMQYLVGLKCGVDASVTLNCVPEMMRNELCTLPETAWARRQCNLQTGMAVKPSLIEEITGCYSIADGPWQELGADIPANATLLSFCASFPLTAPAAFVESFSAKESFEEPDALAAWTLDTSADPEPEFQINIACEGDPPDYSVGDYGDYYSGDYGLKSGAALTNVLGLAPDGRCAARIRAGCTVDYSVGGTNTLSRAFRVANRGCTPGLMAYDMTFAVAFDAREVCEKYDYDIPFNDFAEIFVEINGTETLVKRFSICRDVDSVEFQYVSVNLGKVPLGSTVTPTISVRVTNAQDCVFDSLVILDDLEITPRSGPAPRPTPVQNTQPLPPRPPQPPPELIAPGVVIGSGGGGGGSPRVRRTRRERRVRRQRAGRAMPPRT